MSRHPDPVTPKLRDWITTMSRGGHDVDAILAMMQQAGYAARQSRRILARVLDRPAIALAATTPPPPSPGALRTTPPEAPGMDVDGRLIRVSTSASRPVLRVLHGVLDAEECAALIALARPRLERAMTVDRSGQDQVDAARTSSGMFFTDGETPLIRRIEERIAALVRLPVEHGEALQVLHYEPGQEYKPHQDWFDPDQAGFAEVTRRGGQRIATVVIYLNTPEAGGGTHFPAAGLTVAAHAGDAVYFAYETGASEALHAGLPVLRGEKWIATRWLRERPWRTGA